MHPTESPLQKGGSEDFFDALVAVITGPESIAVPNHACKAIEIANDGVAVQLHAKFFFEVSIGPEVVVAGVVMHGNSAICHAGDGAEQACAAFGNGVLVLVPKVEDVSDQMDFCGGPFMRVVTACRGVFEPADETQFALAAAGRIGGTEVQVRGEVNAVQGGGLAKQFVQFRRQFSTAEVGGGDRAVLVHQQGMGNAAHIAAGNKRSVTVNLDIKYISAGKLDDNLVGKVEVLKRTKTLVFINCKILNSNGIVATASGTWKILS